MTPAHRLKANRIALVFCVHHKPWLIMSTLITTLVQDSPNADVYFLYNVGNGECPDRPSYRRYLDLAASLGPNPQLSSFDPRVRDVCRIRQPNVHNLELENDGALDSGAWYKFIRSELWRAYDYVFFLGEGTLFTRPTSLRAIVEFVESRGIHFLASGHEKRRLPKDVMLNYSRRRPEATPMDVFHDEMIAQTFAVFCRDSGFRAIFDAWADDGSGETQNHVPDVWPRSDLGYRLWILMNSRTPATDGGLTGWAKNQLMHARQSVLKADAAAAHARVVLGDLFSAVGSELVPRVRPAQDSYVHVNGLRRKVTDVVQTTDWGGLRFHRADEPEWFGCTVAHVMSRSFLERFASKLEHDDMYAALNLPFSATALEVIWGFLPQWLGVEKWFTDGIHRVRKHFVTYRREDDPETIAGYVNRYHRGAVSVGWKGDLLKLRALRKDLAWMRDVLPAAYF